MTKFDQDEKIQEAGGNASRFARLVSALALVGGALSVAIAMTVVTSVTMRSPLMKLSGVPGDFELVQMLTAISVFCFLPLCQFKRGHVIVDAVSNGWREVWRHRVDGLWEIIAALVMGLIAWQLMQGAMGMAQSHTRTMVLGFPLAPAVWICAVLSGFLALVALVKGIESLCWQPPRWSSPKSEA